MNAESMGKEVALESAASEGASYTRQFVTFTVGGEIFAVDMAPVQEIIRLPDVVRLPLAPASLLGLSNLRGKVLPIISLRRIFGFSENAHDESTRALVIDLGQPMGFVVDQVACVLNVEAHCIEPVEGIKGTVDSELLTGLIKEVGGFSLVMILDFVRLIEKEFSAIMMDAKSTAVSEATLENLAQGEEEDGGGELQLVSFAVAGQEYAIDIARVQEIVQVPQRIVQVPNAPAHVLGLMTLREHLLPLVSLRSLFHLPVQAMDEKSRVVVITLGAAAVGVVTDSVSEVLRVPKKVVDSMPALLAGDENLSEIAEICRLDGGKRLVCILSVDKMFRHSAVKEALKTMENMEEARRDVVSKETDSHDEEQVVVFRLSEGEFGVPINSVQEIVRVPEELTRVPKAPDFVEGVINLRGAVLPVIDLRKRLGLPNMERNDRQRIMVFLLSGIRTGFIVDAVTEVLKIPKSAIELAPKLSGEQAKLIGRVANLEKQSRLIQLIEPAQLIDPVDAENLEGIGG